MGFESLRPLPGKNVEQIIAEVVEDLERGFYDKKDRDEAIAKILTARIGVDARSSEHQMLDRLLRDIEERYPETGRGKE